MKDVHIPYVELEARDGSEALMPVYALHLRYVPELGVAIADTRDQIEELAEGEGRIFVELKRWRGHLEALEGRTKELAQRSERRSQSILALVEEAEKTASLIKKISMELGEASLNLSKVTCLVDRIAKSSDDLIQIFSALRLAETSTRSEFGSHS